MFCDKKSHIHGTTTGITVNALKRPRLKAHSHVMLHAM